jgi:hypothetical protein
MTRSLSESFGKKIDIEIGLYVIRQIWLRASFGNPQNRRPL